MATCYDAIARPSATIPLPSFARNRTPARSAQSTLPYSTSRFCSREFRDPLLNFEQSIQRNLAAACGFVRATRSSCGTLAFAIRSAFPVQLSGKEQTQADHDGNPVPRQRQRHKRLTVGVLAQRRRVLRRDADGMRSLLRQGGFVDH